MVTLVSGQGRDETCCAWGCAGSQQVVSLHVHGTAAPPRLRACMGLTCCACMAARSQAFEVLGDARSRARYDSELKAALGSSAGAGSTGGGSSSTANTNTKANSSSSSTTNPGGSSKAGATAGSGAGRGGTSASKPGPSSPRSGTAKQQQQHAKGPSAAKGARGWGPHHQEDEEGETDDGGFAEWASFAAANGPGGMRMPCPACGGNHKAELTDLMP